MVKAVAMTRPAKIALMTLSGKRLGQGKRTAEPATMHGSASRPIATMSNRFCGVIGKKLARTPNVRYGSKAVMVECPLSARSGHGTGVPTADNIDVEVVVGHVE